MKSCKGLLSLRLGLIFLVVIGGGGLVEQRWAWSQEEFEESEPSEHTVSKKEVVKKPLILTVGIIQDEVVPFIPKGSRFEGDFKKVVDPKLMKGREKIRFFPKETGVGALTVVDKDGKKIADFHIDVRKSDLQRIMREIQQLLSDIEGITIKVVNGRVVVDGQILLSKDMNRIHSVIKQYGDMASSLVTLSPIAQKKIARLIEQDIGNPEVHVRAVNGKFILEGVVNSEADKKRARTIATTYVPDYIVEQAEADKVILRTQVSPIVDLIQIRPSAAPEPEKIIQVVVHYVELQKDYNKGFRFQWTPDLKDGTEVKFQSSNQSEAGGLLTTLTGTINNLLPKLNWAKQHGHARVLQSSSLIVQNNQKGDLKSVVRVPYQIVNEHGQQSTSFEEAGIVTSVKPVILGARSDSIRMEVEFSLKSLLGITEKGPMISDSTIQTVIVVRSSESAAVGGLISSSSGMQYNKLPPNASQNPIFSLYASKDFRRNQSQFVVFLTPIIKSSAHSGSDKIKRKFRLID